MNSVEEGERELEGKLLRCRSQSFVPLLCHFPHLSTQAIHSNYVDCVRWHCGRILSKSVENEVIRWDPVELGRVLVAYELPQSDIWYMRIALSPCHRLLAAGMSISPMFIECNLKISMRRESSGEDHGLATRCDEWKH